jgi:hypothetical protein
MKLKHYFWLLPLVMVAEFYAYSWITYLMRQPSDRAVLAGTVAFLLLIAGNGYLVRFIISKIKF